MLRRFFTCLLSLTLLFGCACVRHELILRYISPTANPAASEPPRIVVLEFPDITGVPFDQDAEGVAIVDLVTHYADNYLRFYDIRVYTYLDTTLMDGICVNSFGTPLVGTLRICFYDGDGELCGTGEVTTADSVLRLMPGENHIYATIFADGDIRMNDFRFEQLSPFLPEE